MVDSGFFQFNDIDLQISPEQILVDRKSVNHHWKALRTRSAIKAKSGFSTLEVQLKGIKFTDDVDPIDGRTGYQKLRNIVSQVRVTPFVWVENRFLRNSILSGDSSQAMVFAVKAMEVRKTDLDANVIEVDIDMCWFNYLPFTKNYTFKRDIWSPVEVTNPKESKAWRLLWRAEQSRTLNGTPLYSSIPGLDKGFNNNQLSFTQFSHIKVKDYQRLKKEVKALRELKQELAAASRDSDSESLNRKMNESLSQSLDGDQEQAAVLREEIFGKVTSMNRSEDNQQKKNPYKDILDVLTDTIGSETTSKYQIVVGDGWKTTLLNNGRTVSIKQTPDARKPDVDAETEFHKDELLLVERERILNLEEAGIIVNGVSLLFSHNLATIPLIGYPYPTYQHVGGFDTEVSISMVIPHEGGIAALSNFYSVLEDQHHKFRVIPSGQKNIRVQNDIINMCGLREFMPDELITDTVPGQPGTYSATLHLIDNPITSETSEKLEAGQSFTTNHEIRLRIAEILEQNILIDNNVFRVVEDRNFLENLGFFRRDNPHTSVEVQKNTVKKVFDSGTRANSQRTLETTADPIVYQYKGSLKEDDVAFRSIVDKYRQEFSRTYLRLLRRVQQELLVQIKLGEDPITGFLTLNNNDIIGIERLQQDLLPIIQKNTRLQGAYSAVGDQRTEAQIAGEQSGNEDFVARNKRATALEAANSIYATRTAMVSDQDLNNLEQEALSSISNIRDVPTGKISETTLAINRFLSEWQNFVINFLDQIIQNRIRLPQFAKVLEEIERQILDGGSDAYRDWPMQEILHGLQRTGHSALKDLKEASRNAGLQNKNVSISSLINPDFYLFNHQNDILDEVIPNDTIRKAIDAIKTSQGDPKFQAERNWFEGIYQEEIVGAARYTKMNAVASNTAANKSYFDKAEDNPSISNLKTKLNELSNGNSVFAPDDLEGSLGCSIAEGEIEVNAITQGDPLTDKWNSVVNHSSKLSLVPRDYAFSAQHRFGLDSIDFRNEGDYRPPAPVDRNAPSFDWPTDPDTRKVTSEFNPNRVHPIKNRVIPHRGMDISSSNSTNSDGRRILAAADGEIFAVSFSAFERSRGKPYGDEGVRINIKHSDGFISKYFHMRFSLEVQRFSDIFWRKGEFGNLSEDERLTLLTVTKGQVIGHIGETGGAKGAHLHFEIFFAGEAQNPRKYLQPTGEGETIPSEGPVKGVDPNNESLLTKSIDQFRKDMYGGQGFSMLRAYPAFKLYFIESDLGERKYFKFDDFFSYSSVKDITVIRNRKISADLCIIELTNVSGVLTNRKFGGTEARDEQGNIVRESGSPADRNRTNTTQENPIAHMMLQPGTQVQLRLGYNNNPEELEKVFNGLITDVQFTGDNGADLITITCQSFGVELVQTVQGDAKSFGGWFSNGGKTSEILEEMLAFPEVVHFGRWEGGTPQNTQRAILKTDWRRVPSPADDNVFAPTGSKGLFGIFDSTSKYIMYKTTIWEVFQEMTLRHPGYIAYPVPYDGKYGPRMTMFFGLPDQLYFARDPSFEEDDTVNIIEGYLEEAISRFDPRAQQLDRIMDGSISLREEIEDVDAALNEQGLKLDSEQRKAWLQKIIKRFSKDRGFIRPFRKYHLLTSGMHILRNNLTSSSFDTFNTITVQHSGDSPGFDKEMAEVTFSNIDTFSMRVDAGLPDEDVREGFSQYPNCVGEEMAKRYALSMLWRSMKDGYRGELITIGNPSIKPYDVCYIFDEYTDMFGPVEVEQVVHRFSHGSGFVTEITPDMLVHVNQQSTMGTSDAMGLVIEHALKKIGVPSLGASMLANVGHLQKQGEILQNTPRGSASVGNILASTAAASLTAANFGFSAISSMVFNDAENSLGIEGSSTPGGFVGAFIFNKLATRTQLAHPLRYSPLVVHSKPLAGGVPIKRVDGSFIQGIGKWFKDTAEATPLYLNDLIEEYSPNNWVGHSQGSLSETLLGRSR